MTTNDNHATNRVARWTTFAAAVIGLNVGAAALVRSGIGADPYGAFVSSFTRYGITPGAAIATFTAATAAACWAAGVRPRAGTIATIVAGPVLFDAAWVLLEAHRGPLVWAAGFALLTPSAAALTATDIGPGAPELIALTAQHHNHSIRAAAWVRDATFTAAALTLGGQVGAGTAICAAAFSPTYGAAYRRLATALNTQPRGVSRVEPPGGHDPTPSTAT